MLARAKYIPLLLVTLLVLLMPNGCEEDPPCTPCGVGIVFGELTAAGKPIAGNITASSVRDRSHQSDPYIQVAATIDSLGQYSLSLPSGRYLLRIRTSDTGTNFVYQGTLSRRNADTISVTAGADPLQVDVSLGALRLLVDTPPEWEGLTVYAYLRAGDNDLQMIRGRGPAQEGILEILVPAMIPASYQATLRAGAREDLWLPVTDNQSDADWIEIEAGIETTYETEIPSPATITGTITGSWLELMSGHPTLSFFDSDSTRVAYRYAEADGGFSLWIYEPMSLRMLTSISGIKQWYGGDDFQNATEIDLELGQEVNIDIVESGIAGFLDQPGGRCHIDLYDEAQNRMGDTQCHIGSGNFSLSNLRPGIYYVHFAGMPSYPSFWYDAADSIDLATPIEVTEEGEIVWIEPTPVPGGSISGQILDPAGEPVPVAWVRLRAMDPTRAVRNELLGGEEGRFRISHIGNGTYKVGAWNSTFELAWHPGVAEFDSATVITIEGWEDVEGITIQFPE